jgi:MerR family transcriptional regulator, mercuric resistance operon regulatory protein
MHSMTIGALARAAGVNVETVRYYHRVGLIELPVRPAGGIRRYGDEALSRVRFIKRAQELGFSLAEIRRLMRLGDPQGCREARALAAEKLVVVESRLQDLERLRGVLKELIGRCDRRRGRVACPIVESLART